MWKYCYLPTPSNKRFPYWGNHLIKLTNKSLRKSKKYLTILTTLLFAISLNKRSILSKNSRPRKRNKSTPSYKAIVSPLWDLVLLVPQVELPIAHLIPSPALINWQRASRLLTFGKPRKNRRHLWVKFRIQRLTSRLFWNLICKLI